jgi:hypothetical protein
MAVVLYYNSPGAISTEVDEGFIKACAGELPAPAVVAQFFDPITETDQQKWLLGFETTPAAAKFLANKEWIRITRHKKGADIGIGKCGQNKPTNTKTSAKTANKRGGKMRGRGRGKK